MNKLRYIAGTLVGLAFLSIAGCGMRVNSESRNTSPPARQSVPPPVRQPAETRQGLSTGQKVLLLAGAAALYYMYQKHKNAQGTGPQGQYYRSKNGGIYYRDAQHQVHWVTAPQQPIAVPADEYRRYTGQNVNNGNGGVIREAPAGW